MKGTTFEDVFRQRIDEIKKRAAAAGTSITGLCEVTSMSRSTPDRWVIKAPKTIRLIDELEAALSKIEEQQAAQN